MYLNYKVYNCPNRVLMNKNRVDFDLLFFCHIALISLRMIHDGLEHGGLDFLWLGSVLGV